MRFLKYINLFLILIVLIIVGVVYWGFAQSTSAFSISILQHPFVTIFSYLGFIAILLPFEFNNPMFVIRFPSDRVRQLFCINQAVELSMLYVAVLFVMLNVLGALQNEPIVLSQQLIYLAYTVFSMATMAALYVVLSIRVSKLFTVICLGSVIAAAFGLNYFGGDAFIRFNFLFFNMYESVDLTAIICSLISYAVIAVFCFLFTYKKREQNNCREEE